jgi:hypothetical protein
VTVAGIMVVSIDLMRAVVSATRAATLFRNLLAKAIAEFVTRQSTDPTISAIANLRPPSITNGLTPVLSTGIDLSAAINDIGALITRYVDEGGRLESAVLLMSSRNAVALNLLGSPAFESLTAEDGRCAGMLSRSGPRSTARRDIPRTTS